MDLQLKNKVAIVTGGSKGIGRAIVDGLLEEGAAVVNVNRSAEIGLQMQADAEARGQRCFFVQADLTDAAACENAIKKTLSTFSRIDILINNAGVNDGAGLDAGLQAFQQSLQRNLLHYYAMAHHSKAALVASRGCIVNIGSKVCDTGQGGTSGYAASKGAINGLTREWAVELAASGVRVNCVIPAETWTPLYEQCLAAMPNPDQARADIERLIPLETRLTTAEELASTVVFLSSPRSSHTTGQIVYVDGGYTHLDRKCTAPSVADFGAAGE